MYAALFEMTSWLGLTQYIITGDTASTILTKFEDIQSLSCLVRMGRGSGNKKEEQALDKLEAILDKYYSGTLTFKDLSSLNVKISLGTIKCVCIEEGENAAEKLKELYPSASL